MKKLTILMGVFTLGLIFSISAQEKVAQDQPEELDEIVIDTRFKIEKENSGKIVHKITPEMIEQNRGKTVVELINRISGIEINGNTSVFGQNLGYYVRGGRSNEVVILIDGLQVVNPLQNNFDLRYINLDQVASIEISKGASSTLYGTGAATAVIDIRMQKASKSSFNGTVGAFLGTNHTANSNDSGTLVQTTTSINGTLNRLSYLASFSSFDANGVSAAIDALGNQSFNEDPFKRTNFDARLGYEFSNQFTTIVTLSSSEFKNSFDTDSYTDGENQSTDKNYRISVSPKYKYNKGSVHLNYAYTKFDINRLNTAFPGTSEGENSMIDAYVKHNFGKVKLIAGINYQNNQITTFSIPFGGTELTETEFTQDPKTTITDPYANIVYISEKGFNLNTGLRLNNHNIYGNNFVYNFNPSYRFSSKDGYTRIYGSYSTAFVAPSIQDLFSSFGNPELKPQESTTYEFGAEIKKNTYMVNATFFNRDIKNTIIFDPVAFILINGGNTKVNGIEINSSIAMSKNLDVNVNYTYTKNDDEAIRIPKYKTNLGLAYRMTKKTNFSVDYQFVSDRDDTDFRDFLNVKNVTLESYALLDFGATHKLTKKITLYTNITNILNENYQEIFGFSTRGRNFNLGFKYQL